MLGRSYAALQRMPEALAAYKKALALNPNNASLLVDYADLLAFENKSIKGEPIRLVQKALQIDPNNLSHLVLLYFTTVSNISNVMWSGRSF